MNRYFEIVKHLNAGNVRYLVAGGVAANLFGVPRSTHDIDLVVDFEKENLLKLETIIKSLGFRERVPVFARDLWDVAYRKQLRDEKNMLAFTYLETSKGIVSIDLIMNSPFTFEEMWKAQTSRSDGITDMKLVAVEHLMEMKRIAGRPQDIFDIVHLKNLYEKR